MNNKTYIVVYRRLGGTVDFQEITNNLELTLAMLLAQGNIIIDVIDIG